MVVWGELGEMYKTGLNRVTPGQTAINWDDPAQTIGNRDGTSEPGHTGLHRDRTGTKTRATPG